MDGTVTISLADYEKMRESFESSAEEKNRLFEENQKLKENLGKFVMPIIRADFTKVNTRYFNAETIYKKVLEGLDAGTFDVQLIECPTKDPLGIPVQVGYVIKFKNNMESKQG